MWTLNNKEMKRNERRNKSASWSRKLDTTVRKKDQMNKITDPNNIAITHPTCNREIFRSEMAHSDTLLVTFFSTSNKELISHCISTLSSGHNVTKQTLKQEWKASAVWCPTARQTRAKVSWEFTGSIFRVNSFRNVGTDPPSCTASCPWGPLWELLCPILTQHIRLNVLLEQNLRIT
jgi:hypothetical protein